MKTRSLLPPGQFNFLKLILKLGAVKLSPKKFNAKGNVDYNDYQKTPPPPPPPKLAIAISALWTKVPFFKETTTNLNKYLLKRHGLIIADNHSSNGVLSDSKERVHSEI